MTIMPPTKTFGFEREHQKTKNAGPSAVHWLEGHFELMLQGGRSLLTSEHPLIRHKGQVGSKHLLCGHSNDIHQDDVPQCLDLVGVPQSECMGMGKRATKARVKTTACKLRRSSQSGTYR